MRSPIDAQRGRLRGGMLIPASSMRSAQYGPTLSGFDRYVDDDALGFSLKPPKIVRKVAKAIKKNVTLKRALVAGAIVGTAFIPGVAPALLTAGKVVARGAGKAVVGIARKTGGIVGGLFHKQTVPAIFGPAQAPEPQAVAAEPAPQGQGPFAPEAAPTYGPPAPSPAPSPAGGGIAPAPADAGPPDVTAPDASMTQPAGEGGFSAASAVPLLLGAGVVALLLSRPRKRTRAA